MKRLFVLFILMSTLFVRLWATDGCEQKRMSEQEFRAKQQAFLTEKAELTDAEAEAFFPLYFELQDRKKELNAESWKQLHQGKGENVTEAQYEKILESVYDIRQEMNRLEKSYYEKFKKILPFRKIYLIQRAEVKFHRDLVKGMHPKGKGKPGGKSSQQP
ncbi:MAG: hypothetical protein J6C87_02360 [Bacteroides sp.]|nr:hypothetical protein [Bacteroides sp.]